MRIEVDLIHKQVLNKEIRTLRNYSSKLETIVQFFDLYVGTKDLTIKFS